MPWLRLSLLALLGLSLVLAQEVYRPEVELVRKDKRGVAWVSGEEGSLFYADYGDLHVGELVALAEDRAVVGERAVAPNRPTGRPDRSRRCSRRTSSAPGSPSRSVRWA